MQTAAGGDNINRGMGLALLAVLTFGVQDAVAKLLVAEYSSFQITMMRYWAFAGFALFLVARQAPLKAAFRSKKPLLQILRGVLLIADIWLFALALQSVPLPELQAITLVYPLLVTLFAIPLLGEVVGIFRISAVVVGFAGALVIVRPGGLPLDWGVVYAVGSASLYALYIVATRMVSRFDSTATSMAYVGGIGFVLSSAVGLFFWQPVAVEDWGMLAIVMFTTCFAHGVMMHALSIAPASVLQPFNYVSLPWAIVLSFFIFQHLIDPISLIGAAVIVAAGLVVMMRERIKARRA